MELRSAMRLPPSRHVACRAAAVRRLAPRARRRGGEYQYLSISLPHTAAVATRIPPGTCRPCTQYEYARYGSMARQYARGALGTVRLDALTL